LILSVGRQEAADVTLETLKALQEKPIAKYAAFTVETCAYAGTGNVLKVRVRDVVTRPCLAVIGVTCQ
jgi:26S proteasome regulatory subunit N1